MGSRFSHRLRFLVCHSFVVLARAVEWELLVWEDLLLDGLLDVWLRMRLNS